MLVCNVSLSRRRASIAADIAEAAAALDSPGAGNAVFATLVDDPAAVGDRVDAYLGEIMREAASASSTVNAGLTYAAAIAEAATAADLAAAAVPAVLSATVTETATAASTQNATTIVAGPSAMLVGFDVVFINSGASREAYVGGVMVNQ